MLDIDKLHNVALRDGLVGRGQGKTTYYSTLLLQRLELSDSNIALYVLRSKTDIGRVMKMMVELAKSLGYHIINATYEEIKLEIGTVRFITVDQVDDKSRGLSIADIFEEAREDIIYSRSTSNSKKE